MSGRKASLNPLIYGHSMVITHMDGPASADSPLEAAADVSGAEATEAFSTLGSETRLAILLALWEADDPGMEATGLPFSALRERVGMRDSGQFNYHLDKLTGRFIEQTDEGYQLRQAGLKIVRTVIGAAGFDVPSQEPTVIDMPCRHCGGQSAIMYRDERLFRVCTECQGTFESSDLPEGCLIEVELDPAAVTSRSPEEMFSLAKFQLLQAVHNMMEGICPECSGSVGKELDMCEDHDADGTCDACGRAEPVRVRFECLVCKNWAVVPPSTCLYFHPEVVTFFENHGISLQWNIDDFDTLKQIHELIVEKVSFDADEPSRMQVTFSHTGDELRLLLDRELNVVDVAR